METQRLYQPYEIVLLRTERYKERVHKNTFFEMIYVLKGKGIQTINAHQLPYSADKFFMVFPEDRHSFDVQEESVFVCVRFHAVFLKSQPAEWIKKTEFIFHNHNHLPCCILANTSDKPLVRALMEGLVRENESQSQHSSEVSAQLINTVLTIAARNIGMQDNGFSKDGAIMAGSPMLNYIHENIYEADKLRSENIAATFNISPTYISEYFRKVTGESLLQYIIRYKLKLIETRLLYTDKRISEIADEFGFTDESHLNKIFKKYKGASPTAFRKQSLAERVQTTNEAAR